MVRSTPPRVRAAAGAAAAAPPAPPRRDPGTTALALLLALGAAAVQGWLVHDLRQLPSAFFGGDWTYQEACIRTILATGQPMSSPAGAGALPGYMPLYGTLVAGLVSMTGLAVDRAMLLMTVLNHAAASLIVYAVVARRFGGRTGLVMSCLWQWAYGLLVAKYTEFTAQLLVPLFFAALLPFLDSIRPWRALRLGLVVAALGYAHAVAFVGAVVVTAVATTIATLARPADRGRAGAWLGAAGGLAIVGACSLLALGYWYRPLFVFHGHTSPHYVEWNGGQLVSTLRDRLAYAAGLLERSLGLGTPAFTLLHALALAGVWLLVRDRTRRHATIALAAAVTFAWMFHFLATVPLLHTHFVPEYVRSMLVAFAVLLVAAVPVARLVERVPAGAAARAAGVAVLALALAGMALDARALHASEDMVAARRPLPERWRALQSYALAHAPRDAMVLSANELAFGWCALTGRPALVSRRAQNDAFLDLDVRNKDAALALYGFDDDVRRRVLDRWHVEYVLWTTDWIGTEFMVAPDGRVGLNDPLLYFANPAYDDELRRDSVQTAVVNTWVDPTLRGPEFPQFDLSVVAPSARHSNDHPWTPRLDPYLERVWDYREGGRVTAALYRVRRTGGVVTAAR